METKNVDLVIQGGGVKGLAALGAILPLYDAGYRFNRIAGTSAGAIVAALIAAYQRAGRDLHELEGEMARMDYARFKQDSVLEKVAGGVGRGLELLLHDGMYSGEYLYEWLTPLLEGVGVTTFGDLRLDDPDSSMYEYQAYSLVVAATDLSRQVLVRLPWDYDQYGQPAGKQRIVDAVRASMSFPFFFRPYQFTTGQGEQVTWVDGGVLANFPVTLFDRNDGKTPRWPTWCVRISASPPFVDKPLTTAFGEAKALFDTLLSASNNQYHLDDEGIGRREIAVDTSEVSSMDFGLTKEQGQLLFDRGVAAGKAFLAKM
jgi:NTE family protein